MEQQVEKKRRKRVKWGDGARVKRWTSLMKWSGGKNRQLGIIVNDAGTVVICLKGQRKHLVTDLKSLLHTLMNQEAFFNAAAKRNRQARLRNERAGRG